MTSWRSQILKEFTPKVTQLTLVADPDGLLREEIIMEGIRKRGFELLPFEDPIAFRYVYESRYRSSVNRDEQPDLVVVLHSTARDLDFLPYDLLRIARKLSFSLSDIFSNLSYNVVRTLDRGDLDAVFEAQKRHAPGQLGENATKEFVLRHVFEIAPELIKQPSDLLRVLLRRHYLNQRIPPTFDAWFIQLLRQSSTFDDWPLETIIPDREAFLIFLQERWPMFLDQLAGKEKQEVKEVGAPFRMAIEGPLDLPFEHHDIRVYINNFFLEGLLKSVLHTHASSLSQTWVGIGISIDPPGDQLRRLTQLIGNLQSSIPAEEARHNQWLQFARGWAELIVHAHNQPSIIPDKTSAAIKSLQGEVDSRFKEWLKKRFASLINLPPIPPVMLHHLPRFLSRQMDGKRSTTKIALIIIDGLAMDQWLIVREALSMHKPNFRFREQAVFAWIPSLTSVSRQAAFAGKAPIFFPSSIQTTGKEPVLWKQFWIEEGFMPNEVFYTKGLGDVNIDDLSEILTHPKARIIGLVINKIDKIIHGMELGTAGMHNQVRQWAQQPYLHALLNILVDKGFCVYLTSDHGNIEAEGFGRPEEGAVADLRGERVRIYSDMALRSNVKGRFSNTIEWDSLGLPDHFLPLLANDRYAFTLEKENIVCHGGITVEEIIVPLIKVERMSI